MLNFYLWINAALYAAFGVWMTVLPERTAAAIGYVSLSRSGHSEFLTVYGGLQLGLAAFFALGASTPALNRPALIFALCLYTPIVIYRGITVGRYWPVHGLTLGVGALELTLLLAAALLYFLKSA